MIKDFATDDHAELIAANGGVVFQYFDRADRMTKSASSAISQQDIQNFMPPHTHFGVHLITMGAEEDFSANRNGDSASRNSLELYHPTFEKYGCVYREHQNKSPERQGVGQVKLARYNKDMRRGELIVWVAKDKAPDMHKSAKAGKELSWSMSMKLPFDRCSCCNKKSKKVELYCDHLKHKMLKWVPEFQKFAYARNEDDVKFFDISEVKRRADRIATYLGYQFSDDVMAKAAAEDRVITGAEWAAFNNPARERVAFTPWERLTLEKLAAAEEFVRHADARTLTTLAAAAPASLSRAQIETLAQPDFRSVGGELAKYAMILDFASFASMITGKTIEDLRKEASFRDVEGLKLPSLATDMKDNDGCDCGEDAADAVAPDEVGCSFTAEKDAIDKLISDVGDDLGMKPQQVARRAIEGISKEASFHIAPRSLIVRPFDPFYYAMSEAYGHYLVKAAHAAKDAPGVVENTLFREIASMLIFGAQKGCKPASGAA